MGGKPTLCKRLEVEQRLNIITHRWLRVCSGEFYLNRYRRSDSMKKPLKLSEVTFIVKRDYSSMTEEEMEKAYLENIRSIRREYERKYNNREIEEGQRD